jgi:hypothetical protein
VQSILVNGIEYRFFDHIYAASRCGKFLRYLKPHKPTSHPLGYLMLGRRRLAHRVVAICWLETRGGAKLVHHINHDKTDNRADNLMWVTPKEHMGDHHQDIPRGRNMSPEGKQRLRNLRLGSKTSEATKQKQREASLRIGSRPPPRPVGTKVSDAAKSRMSENSHNARGCVVNGVAYASFTKAGLALGEKRHTLRKRCFSQNFPNYRLSE